MEPAAIALRRPWGAPRQKSSPAFLGARRIYLGSAFVETFRLKEKKTTEELNHMLQRGRKSAASLETRPLSAEIEPTRRNPRQRAPEHLSDEMKGWWGEVTGALDLDPHRLRLLRLACESLDRVAEARAIIAAEGLTYTDGHGNPRAHPATTIERDNKIAAGRLIKELNLDPAPTKDPGGIGVMQSALRRPWE